MTFIFACIYIENIVKKKYHYSYNKSKLQSLSSHSHFTTWSLTSLFLIWLLFCCSLSVHSTPPIKHTSTLHSLSQSAHLTLISFSVSIIIYQSLCSGVRLHYKSGSRTSVRPHPVLGLFPYLSVSLGPVENTDEQHIHQHMDTRVIYWFPICFLDFLSRLCLKEYA